VRGAAPGLLVVEMTKVEVLEGVRVVAVDGVLRVDRASATEEVVMADEEGVSVMTLVEGRCIWECCG
jgi:hypothetical protein